MYHELVKAYYDDEDAARAETVAVRLEQAMTRSPDVARSIRGDEIRSIIAELRGDLDAAIASRKAELRKIVRLHKLARSGGHWEIVSKRYDCADLRDRLDLLAILYDKHGMLDKAIRVLRKSRRYCEEHEIEFDAVELLEDLLASRASRRNTAPQTVVTREK